MTGEKTYGYSPDAQDYLRNVPLEVLSPIATQPKHDGLSQAPGVKDDALQYRAADMYH